MPIQPRWGGHPRDRTSGEAGCHVAASSTCRSACAAPCRGVAVVVTEPFVEQHALNFQQCGEYGVAVHPASDIRVDLKLAHGHSSSKPQIVAPQRAVNEANESKTSTSSRDMVGSVRCC